MNDFHTIIVNELAFLKEVLNARNAKLMARPEHAENNLDVPLPLITDTSSPYAALLVKNNFSFEERVILIMALAPHLHPKLLDIFKVEKIPTAFGGTVGKNRAFMPTGETIMFLLAGSDIEKRLELLKIFDKEHLFYKDNLVYLDDAAPNEPELSGTLTASKDFIDLVQRGQVRKPDLSPDFPAKLITTKMDWEDLVVSPNTREQLKELEDWIIYSDELSCDKLLGKKIKPGFKALFYGPPGTGKTLAATLVGKKTGRDVYRIDLATVVSKYIGETEKNLRKLFDRAERKNWILFFDEADALFGKRTNVSDSNDRYANQEVSYLLQRIEYFDGMVILATNMKTNIDGAFMRRFQNIVHFPVPKADQRLALWKNTMPEKIKFDETVDIQKLAEDYELTGAHIANIISHCSLRAIACGEDKLSATMIRAGISRELSKEGRTL